MPVLARTRSARPASATLAAARVDAKRGVVEQVLAGRLPLLAGAARFAALSLDGPTEAADTEGLCRTIIGWAGLALSDRPERAALVGGRLEAELERYLARAGAGLTCRV